MSWLSRVKTNMDTGWFSVRVKELLSAYTYGAHMKVYIQSGHLQNAKPVRPESQSSYQFACPSSSFLSREYTPYRSNLEAGAGLSFAYLRNGTTRRAGRPSHQTVLQGQTRSHGYGHGRSGKGM